MLAPVTVPLTSMTFGSTSSSVSGTKFSTTIVAIRGGIKTYLKRVGLPLSEVEIVSLVPDKF